jgi:2-dehydropantoate 2-reductase
VILGEPDGRPGSRAGAIAAALRAGGMGGEVTGSIRRAVWEKWLGNITGGPLCILARQPMRTILTDPALQETARRMMEEAAAIAAGLGHPIAVDIDARMARAAGMDHRPSILQDLERGRPMEVDAQFTVPLALAAEAGVPTPTLDVMVALVRQVARGVGLYAG